MDLKNFTIGKVSEMLKKREISATELTSKFIDRIKEVDKEISAYLNITEKLAIETARNADKLIADGFQKDLTGIPMAVKDNILVFGEKCTSASKILENYIAPYDATVVKKLKDRGMVILGKANMDEFAMGSSTENSYFGPTKNPNDLNRVPGGSSGGSAAAVSAGECVVALGSDTGGSIRQPASFCGVVGLKPTYGAVSRYGLMAMASSLDQIGPITKTVEDAAILFKNILGWDEMDSTSIKANYDSLLDFSKVENLKGIKLGVPREYFIKGMDSGVEIKIKEAIKKIESLGAEILEISLPNMEYALSAYYIIVPAEVSANLARYDGIKYGYHTKQTENLFDYYLKTRHSGFGVEVKRRIMLGAYTLSAGYYDTYYLKAQKVRTLIKKDFEDAFQKVDAILTPTAPTTAFKFGEKTKDPISMYLEDVFTVPINLAGVPAMSLPCGSIEKDGKKLPVGLQIIGKWFDEKTIFKIGNIFEKNN